MEKQRGLETLDTRPAMEAPRAETSSDLHQRYISSRVFPLSLRMTLILSEYGKRYCWRTPESKFDRQKRHYMT
jgi:hypothetical protein